MSTTVPYWSNMQTLIFELSKVDPGGRFRLRKRPANGGAQQRAKLFLRVVFRRPARLLEREKTAHRCGDVLCDLQSPGLGELALRYADLEYPRVAEKRLRL